jgi:DNA-binding NarL/FixJ family response regulator
MDEAPRPFAISILLVDDHPVVRRGVGNILFESFPHVRLHESSSAVEAVALVRQHSLDLVLLDLTLADGSGLDVLKRIRDIRPTLPVLILSMHPPEQFARRAIAAGASGYLTKDALDSDLVAAVTRLLQGGKYFGAKVLEQVVMGIHPDALERPHERLSDREYQVLRMIGSGKTVSGIAAEMKLSVKTVSTYRVRILRKMQMRTNAELTQYVVRNGLTDM